MKMSIKKSEKIDWKEAEVNLTKKEITESIKKLHGWRLKDTTIEKTFKFNNFEQAVNFIIKVADVASIENHHPDILLWNINNVKLTITTFCTGALSRLDFSLASKIDQI
jgi:4a-hydroxytetrahydrobiopterin dehydratase